MKLVARRFRCVTLGLALSACLGVAPEAKVPPPKLKEFKGQAFFKAAQQDGKWYLLDPDGQHFMSLGVDTVEDVELDNWVKPSEGAYYSPVRNQYGGDEHAFVNSVLSRLEQWKFNTLGAWAWEPYFFARGFPYTVALSLARTGASGENPLFDVFDEDFPERVRSAAAKAKKFKDDKLVVGYFTDNELGWYGLNGWDPGQPSMLERMIELPADHIAHRRALAFLQQRYAKFGDFEAVWRSGLGSFAALQAPVRLRVRSPKMRADADEWAGVVAERYFSVTSAELKAADPNHLNLGARFAGDAPWPVIAAAGKYVDVVSINRYEGSGEFPRAYFDNVYAVTQKPLMVTEYAYAAKDNRSGNKNNATGIHVSVPTQKERAEKARRFLEGGLSAPYMVGFHWFQWADEPSAGRKTDGENVNFGLVDIHDQPYEELVAMFSDVNARALDLHRDASGALPSEFTGPKPGEAMVVKLRELDAPRDLPSPRPLFDKSTKHTPWGDDRAGANMSLALLNGALELGFDAKGWGTGVTLRPGVGPLISNKVLDVRGYRALEVELSAPRGYEYRIFLNESSKDSNGKPSWKGLNDGDGEQWQWEPRVGTGGFVHEELALEQLYFRESAGNQNGNKVVDLQAIEGIEIYVPDAQGSGKITIRKFQFAR